MRCRPILDNSRRRGPLLPVLAWAVACAWCITDGRGAGQPAPDPVDFTAMSLEDLGAVKVPTVVGASKYEQSISAAPSAVSIVTREDIQQFGYRTLGDVLRSVRGFYVTFDRAYNFTGLRGVNRPGDFGGRVLINIDGHRLNEPVYDSAFTHTEFLLDLDLIERVEVIRGPGSSLYGNNAFFTVINVVTRRGAAMKGTEASVSAGSYDTYTGRLSYGRKFAEHGLELLVSGSWLDSRGHASLYYPEFSAVNHGVAEGRDASVAKSAYASLAYGEFTWSIGYVDRTKDVPTGQYGTLFNAPGFRNRDQRAYSELKYGHSFGSGLLLQVRAYADAYHYTAALPFDVPPEVMNHDVSSARWAGAEVLLSRQVGKRHRLTLGGEFREDSKLTVKNFDVDPYYIYVDSQTRASSFALYAQDEVTLLRHLTLNAGVRYDHFSTFGDTLNPRGALVYHPWDSGTFKLISGRAFRAPNAYELYYIAPTFKANPRLGPETIRSFEAVYEQALPGHLWASGSLYRNEIKGLVGQQTDPGDGMNYFDNLANVEVRGFEVELEGRWQRGLRGRISYTYAEAKDLGAQRGLDNSPRHLGKASLAVPLSPKRMVATFELQGMGSRRTGQGKEVPAFWLANATLYTRELRPGIEVSIGLYNIFNRHYSDPSSSDYIQDSIPQDGRTARLKLTGRF